MYAMMDLKTNIKCGWEYAVMGNCPSKSGGRAPFPPPLNTPLIDLSVCIPFTDIDATFKDCLLSIFPIHFLLNDVLEVLQVQAISIFIFTRNIEHVYVLFR